MHAEQVWTRDRLRVHAIAALGEGRQLIVVSNREPYMHQMRDGKVQAIVPAGGLVTALDPVLQACGGVWVAHGAGDADRQAADGSGRLMVPPDDARYTLRRVWLTREEEQGYYYGFSNEGIWPLCHLAHERPVFRALDWEAYRQANLRFAETVLDEIGDGSAVVLVQDYQLALLPRLLKAVRPDLQVGLFWHIPWPNPEAFRICPYGAELLTGMLGADLVGFHLQQHCNSFLDTVDRMLESRLDWDHFSVEFKGHVSRVRPFPISVQDWAERKVPAGEELEQQIAELKQEHNLGNAFIAVGVDRIDYTKGLPERFRAVDRFLEKYPQYRGRFTFVELGAPSRTHIRRYRDHIAQLETIADEINWKYQTGDWQPIHFLVAHHDVRAVHAFLTMASMCIVSSLHDGMNLVAKEYVAAQATREGVLILSEFAGAARELADAIIINPYDTEQFAEAIHSGVEMKAAERHARMDRMHQAVQEHNIYRWAATFLTTLAATRNQVPGT
ncbi:MAG: trehalose-6-phosphate synthase [Acidobacteria bacterium 37-71-11]|nr:MAG: trehalose-6-phosphate synthase [Acidobacteria bacterium 37-71-11]